MKMQDWRKDREIELKKCLAYKSWDHKFLLK